MDTLIAWATGRRSCGSNAAPGGRPDTSSPRLDEEKAALYASPRSLLSTPRSILSTPRSLLSQQRREWRAAAAAQEELFRSWGGSVRREELKQLTRGHLKRRLRDLGSADSEGDGMLFAALVDTVLFWNALARIHDGGEVAEREEALLALRDAGLSIDLLQRALMVVGVPAEERRRLKQPQAATLLYERLRPLLKLGDAGCRGAQEQEQEHEGDEADIGEAAAAVVELPQPEAMQSRWRRKVLDTEDDPPQASFDAIILDMPPAKAVQEEAPPAAPQPSLQQLARDSKFEALDADLKRSLEEIREIDDAAIPEDEGQPLARMFQQARKDLSPISEEA